MCAALLLAGCLWRGGRSERDAVGRRIARGDREYALRADPSHLDEAIAIYLDANGMAPDDRRPMERLAKAHIARAYGYPGSHPDDLGIAREYALSCLLTRAAFAGRVQNEGGRVTPDSVEAIELADADCSTWAAISWSRWMRSRGVAGAALDLEAVEALARRAALLDPGFQDGLPYMALGLALSLPPAPMGPDLDTAAHSYQRALDLGAGQLTPLVELAVTVQGPSGDAAAWRGTLDEVAGATLSAGDPWLMENRRAVERARQSLSEGAPRRGVWMR